MKFFIFDALQAIIITGVGHEYPLSIWWVFKVQKSGILGAWTFCYRGKTQNPKSCCFLVESQFFHVFKVWATDFALCLYERIVLYINFTYG